MFSVSPKTGLALTLLTLRRCTRPGGGLARWRSRRRRIETRPKSETTTEPTSNLRATWNRQAVAAWAIAVEAKRIARQSVGGTHTHTEHARTSTVWWSAAWVHVRHIKSFNRHVHSRLSLSLHLPASPLFFLLSRLCRSQQETTRVEERTKERIQNDGTTERRNDGTTERRNDGTTERRNDGISDDHNTTTLRRVWLWPSALAVWPTTNSIKDEKLDWICTGSITTLRQW